MASETTATSPSAQAIDAYKTYLYRSHSKSVSEIEKLKPGEPVPLKELNHDIAVVQQTIKTIEKFGMEAKEEKAKLNGLMNLKAALLDQSVYLLKQKEKAKAKQKPKEWEWLPGKTAPVGYTVTTGIKKNPILVVKPEPVKTEMKLSGAGSKFSQELLMRMGMLSNCNVLIYQTMGVVSRYGDGLALRCQHCGVEKHLDDKLSLVETTSMFPEVEDFCKAHRHEPSTAEPAKLGPGGRMFRDEDE